MKKYLILALALLMVLSLFACQKTENKPDAEAQPTANDPQPTPEPTEAPTPEPTEAPTPEPEPEPAVVEWPDSIVDEWVLTKLEYSGITMNAADFGMSGTFEFTADGKIIATMGGESVESSYTVSGNTVQMISGDQSVDGEYDPETDSIAFAEEGGKLVLERKSNVPETPESEPAADIPATEADVLGDWTTTKARMGTTDIPLEVLGMSMTFTFNEDGTVAVVTNGESTAEPARWKITDGKVAIGTEDEVLYEMTYDGTYLKILEPNSGVQILFEKQN